MYGYPVMLGKGRHKKKLQYGCPLLLGKGRHKKGYSIVVLSWVREHTKGIYSMAIWPTSLIKKFFFREFIFGPNVPNGPNVPSIRIKVLKSCLLETLVVTDGRQL